MRIGLRNFVLSALLATSLFALPIRAQQDEDKPHVFVTRVVKSDDAIAKQLIAEVEKKLSDGGVVSEVPQDSPLPEGFGISVISIAVDDNTDVIVVEALYNDSDNPNYPNHVAIAAGKVTKENVDKIISIVTSFTIGNYISVHEKLAAEGVKKLPA